MIDHYQEPVANDDSYQEYRDAFAPLAAFILDYEYLRAIKGLNQQDVAERTGTTQSAISRLATMKGKPTYDLLQRISSAVEGRLLVTPLALYSVTLPYEYHRAAQDEAKERGVTVEELLRDLLVSHFRRGIS